jgi:hypothetical protein
MENDEPKRMPFNPAAAADPLRWFEDQPFLEVSPEVLENLGLPPDTFKDATPPKPPSWEVN